MKKKIWLIVLAVVVIIVVIDQRHQAELRRQDLEYMKFVNDPKNAWMWEGDKPMRNWGYKSRKYGPLNPYPGHWGK